MSESLVTCTDCGTSLKISGPSPRGRFVRCPRCSTIFIVYNLQRESTPQTALFPKLSCPDCGATQYSDQPIAGGKFVRCLACAAVYRVPGPPFAVPIPDPAGSGPERAPPAGLAEELPAIIAERVVPRTQEPESAHPERAPSQPRRDSGRNQELAEEELSPREKRRLLRRARRDRSGTWMLVLFAAIVLAAAALAVALILFLRPARIVNGHAMPLLVQQALFK